MGGETHVNMSKSTSYPVLAERPKGQQIHSIYASRLRQFTDGGQYREQGLLGKLYEGRSAGSPTVKLSVYSPPGQTRPTFKEATSHEFKPTATGQSFGPSWSTHWFKIQLTVPSFLKNKEHLEFHWDAGNEGLIWTEKGDVVHGLTGGGERIGWILPKAFRDGKQHTFYIEMACNKMFGNAPGGDSIQPPSPNMYYTLTTADIVAVNLDARALFFDFWIIGDASREFAQDGWEAHKAQQVANAIMDCFIAGSGSKECLKECRKIAQQYIGDKIDSADVYKHGSQDAIVSGIGQCHIDTCWLWPFAETKRKVARSWSNQCDLMDRYPELTFACSQAQQYKWLKQYYPSVFDRVKEKVKEGKFHPIGGSWVEHDTNLPSGESLVRQFLYGQRFFENHFGERSKTFWLPDTFGYSTQLPQVCRQAGMSRFFTQKLSWNNINSFPHTTFNWVALDGSQVLTHMCPAETYTAEANFGDLKRSVTQHKSLDQDNTSLLVFGKGDGGGGPTWEHLEKLRRSRGLSDKVGNLPRVTMGESVDDFFARLEKKAKEGTEYVTWYGELYFELHRGTYTSQANNKRNNRKSEILLHDLEYLATLASIRDLLSKDAPKYNYPKEDIDDMWESVLLCQFHDCLPGSSIEMCYDDSDEIYKKVFETGEKCIKEALGALGFQEGSSDGSYLMAVNTLPWQRTELVQLPKLPGLPKYGMAHGQDGFMQVRPLGSAYPATRAWINEIREGVFELKNSRYKVEVENGTITSLYDSHADREVIPKGKKGHQLVVFDDKPLYWQAWDVEVYHLDSRKELKPSKTVISEDDHYRVSVVTETKISEHSWIKTTISLSAALGDADSYIEMESEVEWRETMKFLKVEFPVDIVNTEATYETQFGLIRRPTHYNTSWDMAKFEVCCHKFADLSESGYGVSILNDSKYGFATSGNVMRLSLLRAPKAPDGHADMGRHHIRYAIFPHSGPLDHHTIRAASAFNNPLKVINHPAPTIVESLFSSFKITGAPNLVIDTIKRGEDDSDVSRGELPKRKGRSIILRVYDSLGGRSKGFLEWGKLPVKKVHWTNVLEDDGEVLHIRDDSVKIELRAFEIATFRLQL